MHSEAKNRHIIDSHARLIDALDKLNRLPGNEMTLFVEDDDHQIIGTLTDGDVRRALVAGLTTDCAVEKVTHRAFRWLSLSRPDVPLIRECRQLGIKVIPVLDNEGRLVDVINLSARHTILPVSAILMAGGKGERLRPLTNDTPKPLLEIDGKAIIDYNIEALIASGVTDITVCANYLWEKIFQHFSEPIDDVRVKCVKEDSPLGTIGAASLVARKNDDGATIVMNSDLLTSISFEDFYLKHIEEKADITVAVIPYQVSVPYAILTTENNRVTGIEEKPAYSYYANAGIYLISNRLLNMLIPDTRIDATDFIQHAVADGLKVAYFPINGTWIDVGSPTDFRQAAEIMRHHRNMSDNN